MKALLLLNTEPVLDAPTPPPRAQGAGRLGPGGGADAFKDAAADNADVLLPIAPFTETAGSFVNAEGRLQSFHGVVKPLGDARPAGRCCACWATCWACRASLRERPSRRARRGAGRPGHAGRALDKCAAAARRPRAAAAPAGGLSAWPTCRSTPPTRWCAAPRRCSSPPMRAAGGRPAPARCGSNWACSPATRVLVGQGRAAAVLPRAWTPRWPPTPCACRRPSRTAALGAMFGAVTVEKGLSRMFEPCINSATPPAGPTLWLVVWSLIKIVAVVLPLMGCVAYLTLWERKAIGWTPDPPGPNRVGPSACSRRSPTR
jgi:NADH-quinone oxidoreductase subunit G